MTSNYKCNLLIPGAGKSGTSSLAYMLDQHPDICLSSPKEPQFFSFNDRYEKGPEFHNSLFDFSGSTKIFCDASQSYFVHSHAIERAKNELVEPKVIIMLRNPVDRAVSHYKWAVRSGMEDLSFEEAVNKKGNLTSYSFVPKINAYWPDGGYLEFSRYRHYCRLWVDVFKEENVLIISAGRFFSETDKELNRIFSFLGISNFSGISKIHGNKSSETRAKVPPGALSKLASILPIGLRKSEAYRSFKNRALLGIAPTVDVDKAQIAEVARMLAKEVEFYEALGS